MRAAVLDQPCAAAHPLPSAPTVVPSVHAQLATETAAGGQARLALPAVPRQRHPSGVQVPCVVCARAGVRDKRGLPVQGVPRDATGDPLCLAHWRSRCDQDRRESSRQLEALGWEEVGALPEAGCPVCGREDQPSSCWLCGFRWMVQARADHEREQELDRAEQEARFEAMAAITQAEDRVADVTRVIEWIRAAAEQYPRGGQARLVEHLADVLHGFGWAGAARGRGRPPTVGPQVLALLVFDADPRSGRRAMPGQDRLIWMTGAQQRTVTKLYADLVRLGLATRTEQGGRLPLHKRMELGRSSNRAEFDLTPLHRSNVDTQARAVCVPVALTVLASLLETLNVVLQAAQDTLDGLRARAGGWTDWTERTQRVRVRQAVAHTVAAIPSRATATAEFIDRNNCYPRSASIGEYLSSCSYWGKRSLPLINGLRPNGRGKTKDGASRSSTRAPHHPDLGRRLQPRRSQPLKQPRTARESVPSRTSPTPAARRMPRPRPAWDEWAYPLATELRKHWTFLARYPLPQVAATLGAQLNQDGLGSLRTDARELADLVERELGRPVLDDPHHGLAYTRAILAQAVAAMQARRAASVAQARQRRTTEPTKVQLGSNGRSMPADQDREAIFARLGLRVGNLRKQDLRKQEPPATSADGWPAVAPIPVPVVSRQCAACQAERTDVELRLAPAPTALCQPCWTRKTR